MVNVMDKPNCYDCKFRRNVPGDTHSSCVHPGGAEVIGNNPLAQALAIFMDYKPIEAEMKEPLRITANPHGIRMGWFHYPVNFDPAWLESCNGFEKRV